MLPMLLPRGARMLGIGALVWLLSACAAGLPLPAAQAPLPSLPRWVTVTDYRTPATPTVSILVVQEEGDDGSRWSLLDPLGMPRARQIWQHGQWRNDGFLPPNPEATALFSALLFAWQPRDTLTQAYAAQRWEQHTTPAGEALRTLYAGERPYWRIIWAHGATADAFSITQHDALLWRISPLSP